MTLRNIAQIAILVVLSSNCTSTSPITPESANVTPAIYLPTETEVHNTPTPIYYPDLPEIVVSVEVPLAASPSHPNSRVNEDLIEPGEPVQVLGADENGGWLIVLYKNRIGWIPAMLSTSGSGTLETLTLVESPTAHCKNFFGSINNFNEEWKSVLSGKVVALGTMYLNNAMGSNGALNLALVNETNKQQINLEIEQSAAGDKGGLFLFSSVLDVNENDKIRLLPVENSSINFPVQVAFYSEECSDTVAQNLAGATSLSNGEEHQPVSTLVIEINTGISGSQLVGSSDETQIFNCSEFRRRADDFNVDVLLDDVVNYQNEKVVSSLTGNEWSHSIEVDTKSHNPSDGILDEIHGLVMCFDSIEHANDAYYRLPKSGVTISEFTRLGELNLYNVRFWGTDKYNIIFVYRNIVAQIKGLGEGSVSSHQVENHTLEQAEIVARNISLIELIIQP